MSRPLAEHIEQQSELALGGLIFGIGVLNAEEVLRYMYATFRQRVPEEDRGQESKYQKETLK